MLTMILKMTGATALYIVATVLLWRFWHRGRNHTFAQKLAVGLFYGLCSVASNHIGIDYGRMVLNVRDIGPLAAGLFFDPLAGILSGLIGGVERFIIGQYFGIGSFTRVACGVSTVLAGLLAAALHKWVYEGNRPSAVNCLLLGAQMEVFHMYAVFITNRDNMSLASMVVETCAVPMIFFTGAGLTICSLIIARLSGNGLKKRIRLPKKETPTGLRFQRRLLAEIFILFAISSGVNYHLQTRMAKETEANGLKTQLDQYRISFQKDHDLSRLKGELHQKNLSTTSFYLLVDADRMLQYTGSGTGEGGIPADEKDVALIADHADRAMFQTVFRLFGTQNCICRSTRLDGPYYLLAGTPDGFIYSAQRTQQLETFFLEILIFTSLYVLTGILVNKLVVRNLEEINQSLARITDGNLNEVVAVDESREFSQLSDDINRTVTSLRELIDAAEKRMGEELKLAAAIQDSALPKNFRLPSENIELHALMIPARQVGGDFYDFFFVSVDRLALVIADVSGKGIPAAMFMMRAKTAIKNDARNGLSPSKILENVNSLLCEDNRARMFVTVWLGILDLKTGLLSCANAGHEYPALMHAGGDYELLKDRHGPVLGVIPGITAPEYEIRMGSGDRLFAYTDGVAEAFNSHEEQYGTGRMISQLNALKNGSQEQILTGMQEDIRKFAGEREQFDDITMLGITYFDSRSES